jgi:hypothetical protein
MADSERKVLRDFLTSPLSVDDAEHEKPSPLLKSIHA